MMKKLSPSEPLVNILLTIDVPPNIPTTKIERFLRVEYGFKTRFLTPYTLEARINKPMEKYRDLLSIIERILNSIPRDVRICIDHWISLKNCLCRKSSKIMGDRIMCIEELGGKSIYIYCNTRKGYSTIRFFKQKPLAQIDPLQIPRSAFIYCGEINEVKEYLKEIYRNIEIINDILSKPTDTILP